MKYKAPIDIHEATVEQFYERSPEGEVIADGMIAGLAAAVRVTRGNSEALAAFSDAVQQDRTITPESAALRLRENALRLAESTAKKLDEAKAKVQAEIADLDKRTGTPPPPRDQLSASIEAEVRARLAAMQDGPRDKAIGAAFAEKDETIVAAALRGPPMLVGLSKAGQEMLRHRYRLAFHSADHARRQRLASALEATQRSGESFIRFVAGMATSQTVAVAEASANARSAEEAIAAAVAQ